MVRRSSSHRHIMPSRIKVSSNILGQDSWRASPIIALRIPSRFLQKGKSHPGLHTCTTWALLCHYPCAHVPQPFPQPVKVQSHFCVPRCRFRSQAFICSEHLG